MINFNHTVELKPAKAFLVSKCLRRVFSAISSGTKHLFVVLWNGASRNRFCLEERVCLHTLCALQQGIVRGCSWMLREGAARERQAQPVLGLEPAGSYSSV